MGNKILEFIIRAKDATGAGISKARQAFQGLSNKVGGSIKSMAGSMLGLVGVSVSVGAAVAGLAKTIKAAFEFERYETQFKVLFGNLEQAKSHMADLQKFSAETPFQFGDIAQASRQLHILTGGIMGGVESLKLVGDAAAATGAGFGELSMWVGRAYGAIKAGRPFGEAAMRLMELGVLTPDVRAEMEKLQAEGASNAEVWGKLQEALEKYKGGMEEMSKTGEGLFSTLKDNWNLALAEFGKQFMDVAKDGIQALTDKLKQLKEDGSIAVWAENAKKALAVLGKGIENISTSFGWLKDKVKETAAYWGAVAGGASMSDAAAIASQTIQADKDAAAQKKANAAQKTAEAAAEEEKTLQQKIADDLASSQKQIDEEKQAKWLKDQEEIWKKADKAAKDATEKQAKDLAREKIKIEKKAIRGQLDGNAADLDQQQGMLGPAQDRLNKANDAVNQAWGWIRDPKSFKSQLREEKAQAKAEARFEKDAERIKDMQDWRTRKLSEKDEAVRRMMLAKEEQKAAQNELKLIEKHVAHLEQIRKDLQKALMAAGG